MGRTRDRMRLWGGGPFLFTFLTGKEDVRSSMVSFLGSPKKVPMYIKPAGHQDGVILVKRICKEINGTE